MRRVLASIGSISRRPPAPVSKPTNLIEPPMAAALIDSSIVPAPPVSTTWSTPAPLVFPFIADHALRTQSLEPVDLRLTSGDRKDSSTRGERELQREDAHAAGTLHQHRLSGLEVTELEEGIPSCQGRSWERRRFLERQRIGNLDKPTLIPLEVSGKNPIDGATERQVPVLGFERPRRPIRHLR